MKAAHERVLDTSKPTTRESVRPKRRGLRALALAGVITVTGAGAGIATGTIESPLKDNGGEQTDTKAMTDRTINYEGGQIDIYTKYADLPTTVVRYNKDGSVLKKSQGKGLLMPLPYAVESGLVTKEQAQSFQSDVESLTVAEPGVFMAPQLEGTMLYAYKLDGSDAGVELMSIAYESTDAGGPLFEICTRDNKYCGAFGSATGIVHDTESLPEYPMFRDGNRDIAVQLINAERS